jgi:2-dehydro-3-deoxy-D-gluconate 5-dehydrogenase
MSEETKRWIRTGNIFLLLFVAVSGYLYFTRGEYSLNILNKAFAHTGALTAAITLVIGPLSAKIIYFARYMTIRRHLGLSAFGFLLLHITTSLIQTEEFPIFGWYLERWIPIGLGLFAAALWTYMAYLSRNIKIRQMGADRWKKQLRLAGDLAFGGALLHISILKYPIWLRFFNTVSGKTVGENAVFTPPLTLIVSMMLFGVIVYRLYNAYQFKHKRQIHAVKEVNMKMEITEGAQLLNLHGKTAIVTGAVGIGYGIAYRLAEAGANVMVASRDEASVKETASKLTQKGWKVQGIKTDVSQEEDVKQMVSATVAAFGSVDILVNNAGIYPSIPVSQMTLSDFDNVLSINLKGVFLCTKYTSEQMIKQGNGGKIINVTSIDALHPSSVGLAHYDASKHGVWGFTKNVALELAQHKIWVNAIAPGGIITPGVQKLQGKMPVAQGVDMAKVMESFLAKIPMHRMGEADDIGKVALFLASDMSSYMTGSQIVVDGGVLLS